MRSRHQPSERLPTMIFSRAGFVEVPLLREFGLVLTIAAVFMGGLFALQTTNLDTALDESGLSKPFSDRPVRRLSLSEDGHRLCVLHGPDEIAELNLVTNTTETLYLSSTEHILHSAHSAKGSTAVAVLDDYEVHFLRDGELIWVDEVDLVRQSPLHAAVSADGNLVLVIFNRGAVRGWDLSTDPPTSFQYELPKLTVSASVDSAGSKLFAAHNDGTLAIYDARDGRCLQVLAEQHSRITAAALSSDGCWWVTSGTDHTLRVWEISSGREVWRAATSELGEVWSVVLSPDNGWIAAAGANHGILVWSIPDRTLMRRLIGHQCPVRALCFSPTDNTLYSASLDGTIRAWSIPLGQELRRIL
jgi:WD40 repeat protein